MPCTVTGTVFRLLTGVAERRLLDSCSAGHQALNNRRERILFLEP